MALEGRRLFKGDGEADTLNKVLNEPIPPLKNSGSSVAREVEAVLEGALDRERTRRFATAALFADALERAAHAVDAVATHKDVAAYLDEVLGSEIVAQREMVRMLIARSEPKPKSLSMPPPAPTPPTLPRLGHRPLSPESTPSSIASVPSAVVSSHSLPPSMGPMLPPEPARSAPRGRLRPWLMAVIFVIVGVFGWLRWAESRAKGPASTLGKSGAAGEVAGEPTVAVPPATPSPGAATSVVSPSLASSEAGVGDSIEAGPSSAVDPAGGSAAVVRPPHHPSAPAASRPGPPSASGASMPDDISRNPYR